MTCWRFRVRRRPTVTCTSPVPLTDMAVPNFLPRGMPMLTSGMFTFRRPETLLTAMPNEVMTIVLIPWCRGSLLKNDTCRLALVTLQRDMLQLRARSILASFPHRPELN